MRNNGNVWEYIAVYVDDLLLAMKDPVEVLERLKTQYGYKLKGDGKISYHLGMDFGSDADKMLWLSPIKYFKNNNGRLPSSIR